MRRSQRLKKSAGMGILVAIFIIFFFIFPASADGNLITSDIVSDLDSPKHFLWANITFIDVSGQEQTISNAKAHGPVVVHLFTTWCPASTRQLTQSTEFLKENGEVTVISLDIDPKETDKDIKAHIAKNALLGVFAVAPQELISALSNEFGSGIALRIPQTIIITDDSATYIGAGVASKEKMKNAVSDYLQR